MPEPTNEQNAQGQGNGGEAQGPASWDEALKGLAPELQNLYSAHITGLQNTVKATRQERDEFAKQIRDLSAKAEKGSELEKSLTEISAKVEIAERRASFFEDAAKPEIGCKNPRLAWTLAQSDNLFARNGSPDWAAIKAAAPELFGAPSVNANAGAGTGGGTPKPDMNAWIRASAGQR